MDLYVLNSTLRREAVIDWFTSLIWTERYAAYGDFEVHIHSTNQSRKLLSVGAKLAITESYRVMVVETVENAEDSEGRSMLKVTGRSMEAVLLDRIAKYVPGELTGEPNWPLTGTPGDIARYIFDQICITGVIDVGDIIPRCSPGSFLPADTIPESDETLDISLEPTTVYDAVKQMCDYARHGFRFVRLDDTGWLYFDVHTGTNRTSSQDDFPAVIFAPDLDNLQGVTELKSVAQMKNVAYVYTDTDSVMVYADGVDALVAGFERKVLLVKADNLDPALTGTALTAALVQKGKAELSKHRSISGFDGEIPQFGSYKYGFDYNLGDLVEMRNEDGLTNQMRVTEQIFVSDEQGDRSYPTLTIDIFIEPGTWLAWDFNETWSEAEGVWADL